MNRDGLEYRAGPASVLTVRLEERAAPVGRLFSGYAARFDSPSEPLPFVETIARGAFARSLASGRDIKAFTNHDDGRLLGTTASGTLRLREDDRGLAVELDLPDTSDGRDVAELTRRGDLYGMSFGFKVQRDRWSPDGTRRELLDVDLYEVSPVTGWPAYAATSAKVG